MSAERQIQITNLAFLLGLWSCVNTTCLRSHMCESQAIFLDEDIQFVLNYIDNTALVLHFLIWNMSIKANCWRWYRAGSVLVLRRRKFRPATPSLSPTNLEARERARPRLNLPSMISTLKLQRKTKKNSHSPNFVFELDDVNNIFNFFCCIIQAPSISFVCLVEIPLPRGGSHLFTFPYRTCNLGPGHTCVHDAPSVVQWRGKWDMATPIRSLSNPMKVLNGLNSFSDYFM